ncbi:hypothetical protein AAB992_30595 [Burkholderia contaminans]|uniref:hypothetical protein n=1 Tax=Burkholderia contaminans TaxID=488447 RepID=UPI00241632F3|nr:hypothetical protein [Burkholderia contaminans]WFN15123.1 hypothetical protein LXE92_33485 [Burkholderia contaminans]
MSNTRSRSASAPHVFTSSRSNPSWLMQPDTKRVRRDATVARSLLQCFRSASYSSRFPHLSLASESALLMAEKIKAVFRPISFDPFHELRDEIPDENGERSRCGIPESGPPSQCAIDCRRLIDRAGHLGASGGDRITGSPPGTCGQASTECDRRECWLDE